MFTAEENKEHDAWWAKLGVAFRALPAPTTPGAEAEAEGMKFRTERWRDGITWEWCLSWKLLRDDGTDAHISSRRHVDPNQAD